MTLTITLHGQVVRCAGAGCNARTWAASGNAATLATWTVEQYPHLCWCPTCRPKPKAEAAPQVQPAAKQPARARTGRGGRVAFEIGSRVVLARDCCEVVGEIVDMRPIGGAWRYKVQYPDTSIVYAKARDLRIASEQMQEETV